MRFIVNLVALSALSFAIMGCRSGTGVIPNSHTNSNPFGLTECNRAAFQDGISSGTKYAKHRDGKSFTVPSVPEEYHASETTRSAWVRGHTIGFLKFRSKNMEPIEGIGEMIVIEQDGSAPVGAGQ